ncbi:signal peptide peptidase SppA [Bauldia litoralis]|uniref:Protease-4 n=1 Tax=Bauldia litoralis TaxID=665467 RepID=A0A1G6BKV9_9HYPH|nr:signal peptide peptidase SppA [Bauldia litoralis]SDB21225.1 protease-4 [Bauldia litoralis]
MSLTADQIVDRRSLRRKLSVWRVVAFLALALLVVGGAAVVAGVNGFAGITPPQIARVTISGFISEDRDQLEMLDKITEAKGVKGVIVSIDSTGGSTAGGEALYEALRRMAKEKPVVASMETVGASAAYMTAIAADHVIARRTTITGSIGVIFQIPQVGGLLDKLGVDIEEVKSSPLKAAPSMFEPASPEALAVINSVVRDSYDWFVDIVAERRDLDRADALTLADGRIYTGRQALDARLIDEIGGEETAIDWLVSKGVKRSLPVKDWEPANDDAGFLSADLAVLWIARQLGLGPAVTHGGLVDRIVAERLKLDGLMSVWQGPASGSDGPAEGALR